MERRDQDVAIPASSLGLTDVSYGRNLGCRDAIVDEGLQRHDLTELPAPRPRLGRLRRSDKLDVGEALLHEIGAEAGLLAPRQPCRSLALAAEQVPHETCFALGLSHA